MFQMREAFLSLSHFYVETHWSSKTIHIWVRGGGIDTQLTFYKVSEIFKHTS